MEANPGFRVSSRDRIEIKSLNLSGGIGENH